MNPERLHQVADSFYSVFPVWVNKHVTSTPCSVWLWHCEVPTLLCTAAQCSSPLLGTWHLSAWCNGRMMVFLCPEAASQWQLFCIRSGLHSCWSLLAPLGRVCTTDCICFARHGQACSRPRAEHLNLPGPGDPTQGQLHQSICKML